MQHLLLRSLDQKSAVHLCSSHRSLKISCIIRHLWPYQISLSDRLYDRDIRLLLKVSQIGTTWVKNGTFNIKFSVHLSSASLGSLLHTVMAGVQWWSYRKRYIEYRYLCKYRHRIEADEKISIFRYLRKRTETKKNKKERQKHIIKRGGAVRI